MTTPKKGFQGQSKERQETLTRLFRGFPQFDADADILAIVTEEDGRNAVPGDPERCLLALSYKRALDSRHVVFLRTVAYIDVPCTKAETRSYGVDRKVLRFAIPARTRRLIEALDRGGQVDLGVFCLRAPSKHERLDAPRRVSKGPGGHKPKSNRNIDSLTLDGVRNGSGTYQVFASARGGVVQQTAA